MGRLAHMEGFLMLGFILEPARIIILFIVFFSFSVAD